MKISKLFLAAPILISLLALVAPTTSAQTLAAVSGHLLNPDSTPAANADACFTLQNYKPNLPRITSTGTLVSPTHFCISSSPSDGSISSNIFRNDAITPAGTYWRVDFMVGGIQKSSSSFNIAAANFNLDSATPITTAPVVPAPTGDTTYARLDAGNQPFTGNVTAPNVTATGQLKSTVATGTPPLVVASTTMVANLDAQFLNGLAGPNNPIVGTADTQTLSNKTFDISANTLKNSTNTAGHYARNNGTTGYVDSAIQSTDLPATTSQCTGVQFSRGQASGGTENCATPPAFVASGASHAVGYVPDPGASAGTTKFLREDATWAVPLVNVTVLSTTQCTLGSNVSLTSTVLTTILSCATTAPSSGCPCRAFVEYVVFASGTSSTQAVEAEITDGTNVFNGAAGNDAATTSAANGTGASGMSPVTYSNSANTTFTLKAETDHTGTALASSGLLSLPTRIRVSYVSSN